MTILVYFDIETSGFRSVNVAEILSLAAVSESKDKGVSTFQRYILPQNGILPSATEINGFTLVNGTLHRNDESVSCGIFSFWTHQASAE